MKIICDIGNTNSKILIIGNQVRFVKLTTSKVLNFVKKYKDYTFFVSTVVNEIENELKQSCKSINVITYKDLQDSLPIKYDTTNLGSDRVLSAFAVKRIFGKNSLIVSFGTAIVLDYINRKGEYVGGEIFPGLKLLSDSLFYATSRLPLISKNIILKSKKTLVGSNTRDCIISGILNFCSAGINNFIKELKPKNVILTGGDAYLFKKYISSNTKIYLIDNLVILGIVLYLLDRHIMDKFELYKIAKKQYFGKTLDIRKII